MKDLVPISKFGLIITNVKLCTGNKVSISLFFDLSRRFNRLTCRVDDANLLQFMNSVKPKDMFCLDQLSLNQVCGDTAGDNSSYPSIQAKLDLRTATCNLFIGPCPQ